MPADPVRLSALAATAAYALGVALLLRAPTRVDTRAAWLLAWLVALAHTLTAFGFAHGWSHAEAVAHTARVSGFGFGVYVNEAFVLVWLVDALWRLRRRPPAWWTWIAHGFLAFIVFNAAIVFGSWPARLLGVACAAGVAVGWRGRLASRTPNE